MKKLIFILLLIPGLMRLNAQNNKIDQLQSLEQSQPDGATATLKSASRLFADKNDLTSVILIIPADSIVTLLGKDSTYLHVVYNDTEGYIFSRQATINKMPVSQSNTQQQQQQQQVGDNRQVQDQQQSRFAYLENKYGSGMAARLNSGKIWKGMNADMVSDSWGSPVKINRVISGNIVKEEWIYRNTWLYFENSTLLEWGSIKK